VNHTLSGAWMHTIAFSGYWTHESGRFYRPTPITVFSYQAPLSPHLSMAAPCFIDFL